MKFVAFLLITFSIIAVVINALKYRMTEELEDYFARLKQNFPEEFEAVGGIEGILKDHGLPV